MLGDNVVIDIRVLGPGDETVLQNLAPGVFDKPIDTNLTAEFLNDDRHHIAVALDGNMVVGFASGVTYVHPDKPVELWINEVGVAPSHRKQGIGKRVIQAIFDVGRASGCHGAWVLTDRLNAPAMQLYKSVGGTEDPGKTVMYSFMLDV
jgi:GNAT superfamily N-acetyltransferase